MSSPKLPIAISPKAALDVEEILFYSLYHWGERQHDAYELALNDTFELIGNFPAIGIRRDEVRSGFRSRKCGQHVIFYEALADSIVIRRIVHEKVDVTLIDEW